MFDKLHEIEKRCEELERLLSRPDVLNNRSEFQKYAREHSEISPIVDLYRRYGKKKAQLREDQELLKEGDDEWKELLKEEIPRLREEIAAIEEELKILLLPRDPNDDRNVFLEIRAGTGGDEAADLFRMYARYAESRGWRMEIVSATQGGGMGGFKEIIGMIEGRGAYSRLKYESGVHRVQRVPLTEAQGRIHTSAVTVAILPEAEDVEVDIDPGELRIDVYRSTGHGGQSVNTTDSAVRITHLPSGLVVTCQDEKSQHKNKAKAMKVLRARLLDRKQAEQDALISETRKKQVGTGDRSERIRTYNFPQGRVTDHRIGMTLYSLEKVLDGFIEEFIDGLITHYQTEALKAAAS